MRLQVADGSSTHAGIRAVGAYHWLGSVKAIRGRRFILRLIFR